MKLIYFIFYIENNSIESLIDIFQIVYIVFILAINQIYGPYMLYIFNKINITLAKMAIIKYMQVLFIISTVIYKEKIEITLFILDIFYALIMALVINKEKIESIKFKSCIFCI